MTVKFHEMKNLVSPIISIDEYKPKIGEANETVVVAFEVASEQPAKDLSNLIETDVTENLDVDISQGPNREGKFLVFVEFARDKKLHEKIVKIAKTVSNVADINEWKFTYYKGDKELELTEDNLGETVVNDKNEYVIRFRDESSDEETTNEEIDRIRQLAGLQ